MNFELSEDQQSICTSIQKLCAQFGDDYWLAKDRDAEFPHEFHRAFADGGWLGIAMPERYGGRIRRSDERRIGDSHEYFWPQSRCRFW
jgi:acyl-CoA dehydrogenase